MNAFCFTRRLAFAIGALCFVDFVFSDIASAAPCALRVPCGATIAYQNTEDESPSWIFRHSTYSHDPETGARVAQYMRTPPVEPLPDQREVTSRYRRIQTNLRGTDGSSDTTFEVQAWGNGRGGLDAEWERFHEAWKESYLQGGYYNQTPGWNGRWGNGPWRGGWNGGGDGGGGWGGGGWNGGGPWNGGGGPWGGGGWNGGGPWQGGPGGYGPPNGGGPGPGPGGP